MKNFNKEDILAFIKKYEKKEGYISHSEYITSCIFPEHNDKNPSFAINLETGLYNCFLCGGGTFDQLLKFFNEELFQNNEKSLFNIEIKQEEEENEEDLLEVVLPFQNDIYPDWILERGFSQKLAFKWEMCYNEFTGSLVIPIRDYRKILVGWVCRRPSGVEPKYVYNLGLEKEKILFGEYQLRSEQNFVCICEGPLDAIWLDQHGYNAIALLGMQLSKAQQKRLVKLNKGEYIICLDNDEAGKRGIYGYRDKRNVYHPGFISKMKKNGMLSIISLPPDKKDVQDIKDSQQLKNIIENRKIIY